MSNPYEMMYILRPDLSEEQVSQSVQKYNDFLTNYGVQDIAVKNLGRRKLAYSIKKHSDGIYIQLNYKADGTQVAPLERAMRLSDEVIRYLTIALKDELVLSTPADDNNADSQEDGE
jgi:small subunit ribosomal protein S6